MRIKQESRGGRFQADVVATSECEVLFVSKGVYGMNLRPLRAPRVLRQAATGTMQTLAVATQTVAEAEAALQASAAHLSSISSHLSSLTAQGSLPAAVSRTQTGLKAAVSRTQTGLTRDGILSELHSAALPAPSQLMSEGASAASSIYRDPRYADPRMSRTQSESLAKAQLEARAQSAVVEADRAVAQEAAGATACARRAVTAAVDGALSGDGSNNDNDNHNDNNNNTNYNNNNTDNDNNNNNDDNNDNEHDNNHY